MRIYVGYDAREQLAYEVLKLSIDKSSSSAEVLPIKHQDLRSRGLFRRPWLVDGVSGQRIDLVDGRPFSTEFSHSRFFVPKLNEFKGWALFVDCDMLCLKDIGRLSEYYDDRYAVLVVKQTHNPTQETKMDGQVQSSYPRKNWSSVILWNCAHPSNRVLEAHFLNSSLGRDLHQFSWLADEEIGTLDPTWNWIEGVSPYSTQPGLIHFTAGGPWFEGCEGGTHGHLWLRYYHEWLMREATLVEARLKA